MTAGNASGINDGAAAMLVMTEEKAKALGVKPIAVLDSFGTSGVDPSIMGIGPVEAVRQALKRSNKSVSDIDVFELNEAFASQSLAVDRELQLPQDKVNVKGGAIALGHPIGASGARILVTLLHQLNETTKRVSLHYVLVEDKVSLLLSLTMRRDNAWVKSLRILNLPLNI